MESIEQQHIHDQIVALGVVSDRLYKEESFFGTDKLGFWAMGYAFIEDSLYEFQHSPESKIRVSSIVKLFTLPSRCVQCGTPYKPFEPKCYFTKFIGPKCSYCCHYDTCMNILLYRKDELISRR
ncbi:MAG: hypothetical protein ACFFG0_11505 [Candidatus Thorarchaeota archaeon]